jgi:membrane protein DedA with SNARE-associated domain
MFELASIEAYMQTFALRVPLELFVFIGSIIEEIIAPIPSPLGPTIAGALAKTQGYTIFLLFILAVVAAFGKMLGEWVIYFIADKAENFFFKRFGKFFGITHEQIENIGKYFTGGWRDFTILIILRMIPVMPSAPISFIAGLIKLNLKTYLAASFFGSIVRGFIFLYFGYIGFSAYHVLFSGINNIESAITVLIAISLLAVFIWAYHKRSSTTLSTLLDKYLK